MLVIVNVESRGACYGEFVTVVLLFAAKLAEDGTLATTKSQMDLLEKKETREELSFPIPEGYVDREALAVRLRCACVCENFLARNLSSFVPHCDG